MGSSLKKTAFCELTDEMLSSGLEEYIELTRKPRFICGKCLRLARRKSNLCKPKRIDTKAGEASSG